MLSQLDAELVLQHKTPSSVAHYPGWHAALLCLGPSGIRTFLANELMQDMQSQLCLDQLCLN
jgi:hypothetical protein